MSRKTIIWIVAGVLAAAVLAAVGIVSYHVGFDHGGGRSVAILRGPLRGNGFGNGFGVAFGRGGVAFPFFGAFLVLLIGGVAGAAIVYLTRRGGRPAGAVAAGYAAAPDAGRPLDPRWQQFEEWHRQAHYPAGSGGAATAVTPDPATTPAAPPDPAPDAPAATATPPAETPPADE